MDDILGEWLAWDFNMFFMPCLTGKAKHLYNQPETIAKYFSVLESFDNNALEAYKIGIYETLYDMSEHNDAEAIWETFRICPWLDPHGYYYDSGFQTVMDVAIEHSATAAIAALCECGVDPDYVQEGNSLVSALFLYDTDDAVAPVLVAHGAELDWASLFKLFVVDDRREYCAELLACASPFGREEIKRLLDFLDSYENGKKPWNSDFFIPFEKLGNSEKRRLKDLKEKLGDSYANKA